MFHGDAESRRHSHDGREVPAKFRAHGSTSSLLAKIADDGACGEPGETTCELPTGQHEKSLSGGELRLWRFGAHVAEGRRESVAKGEVEHHDPVASNSSITRLLSSRQEEKVKELVDEFSQPAAPALPKEPPVLQSGVLMKDSTIHVLKRKVNHQVGEPNGQQVAKQERMKSSRWISVWLGCFNLMT